VFGSLYELEFTFPSEISDLIQADLRFSGLFVSPYVLREVLADTLFVSLYGSRLAPRLEITKRSKLLQKYP
jgi:hypothetical protein